MIIQDKRNNCYYEFNPQQGSLTRNGRFNAFLGKRVMPNGKRSLVTILVFENLQSIGVMSMRDAFKRQLAFPELSRIYSFVEVKNSQSGKATAYCIMEYIDGVPLDKFVSGQLNSATPASKSIMDGLYSGYCNDKEEFSVRIVKELSKVSDVLNGNGFSVANLDPSTVFITTNGAIKLMDYGIPTNQIIASSEIIVFGRMLHLMLTGIEFNGAVRNVKSPKLKSIINKAIGKKYRDTDSFRRAFDKRNDWWKIILSVLIGILLVVGLLLVIKNCQGPDEETHSINYGGGTQETIREPNVDYTGSGGKSDDTDFQKGLKDLEKSQQKKSKKKQRNTDNIQRDEVEKSDSKQMDQKKDDTSLKNNVII